MFTLAQATAAAHEVATETAPAREIVPSVWDWSKWDSTTWSFVLMGTLVAILILTWGCVRFWLVVTRPPKIKDVPTPTLDRMNEQALSHMGPEGDGDQIEDDNAPSDLLAAVPEEEAKENVEQDPPK